MSSDVESVVRPLAMCGSRKKEKKQEKLVKREEKHNHIRRSRDTDGVLGERVTWTRLGVKHDTQCSNRPLDCIRCMCVCV